MIIAGTRDNVTTNALNTFLKVAQIHYLGKSGDDVLGVSSLRIVTNNGSNVQEIKQDTDTVINILGKVPE